MFSKRLNGWSVVFVICATLWFELALPQSASASTRLELPNTATSEQKQEIARLKAEQERLLKQLKRELASLSTGSTSTQSARDRDRRAQLELLLSEVEERMRAEGRTRYVTAMTDDPALRAYFERVQRRVERQGDADFPKANGKSLHGRVVVSFALTPVGKIERIDIAQSTSSALSQHSIRLLKQLEPFESFPPEIANRFDRMVITVPFDYKPRTSPD
ncbi:energy transducer TonB [Pelomonas sp. Root1237]|uniref:energy transducer TonB family protein n=1 Tax=Pelomonas sp. Root1237 TaxID=1736434 RepID=UPI0009EAFAFB|nr:energy transducer TonB [Pelomonas sp. Root1237]